MRVLMIVFLLCLIALVSPTGLPAAHNNAPAAQTMWQLNYADEFNAGSDLVGWNIDRGDGNDWIDTGAGFLHLESNWGYTYPMVWRNDLYNSINANNLDYAVEVRFRRTYLTAYGSAFGVGTTNFSGARFAAGDPYPLNNFENIVHNEQHQPSQPGSFGGNENICRNQDRKPIPVDYTWHVGRAEFLGGIGYHYFDGAFIGSATCSSRPLSTYFGNAYVQPFIGSWTSLDIDYIRIYIRVVAVPTSTPSLMPTATPTFTPTSTRTPTPIPTATPTATPNLTSALALSRDYALLLQCGPRVGEPAQVLRGQLTGSSVSGHLIRVVLTDPGLITNTYFAVTDGAGSFRLDAASTGDSCFGSSEVGDWSAQAYDIASGLASNTVQWSVEWFIIHTTK